MSDPSVAVVCSACQAAIEIPQSWLGKRRPCPKCHTWIQMADAPGTAPAAANPAAVDPYGHTLVSRPGIDSSADVHPSAPTVGPADAAPAAPPGSGAGANQPLTFADRLKHVSGQNAVRRPTSSNPAATSNPPKNRPTAGNAPPPGSPGSPGSPGRSQPPARPTGQTEVLVGGDPESLAWDDDKNQGWDKENSAGDRRPGSGERPGYSPRNRRRSEEPPVPRGGVLAMVGLGAALLTILLGVVICLGIVMAGTSAVNGGTPDEAWVVGLGCAVLLTPVIALAGMVFSGIALFVGTSRKGMAIAGLLINGVFLLGILGLLCIGLANS